MRATFVPRAIALAMLVTAAPLPAARAATADLPSNTSYIQLLKRAQREQLMREWLNSRRERAELRARQAAGRKGERARTPRVPASFEPVTGAPAAVAPKRSATSVSSFPPANVRVNNPVGDGSFAGQAEESVGADGSNVLCTFNDGQGFYSGLGLQGYAYSNDGGTTWTDGGIPPAPPGWTWNSDPIVTVDEKSHVFYVTALGDSNATTPANSVNGILVVSATFSGATAPTWGTPHVVIRASNGTFTYDKEWMVADSTSHNLYLVYTRFTASSDDIFFQRSLNQGVTWGAPIQMSVVSEQGAVQGARVVVGAGPAAPVYVAWFSIGPVDADFYKVRKSTTAGASWGAAVTAVSAFHAFENGAPGFNRGNSVDFPSLAIDRTVGGTHSGRLYLAWHESVNYYGDTLYFSPYTGAGNKNEVEPNGTPAQATPFTLGQTLRGTLTDGDQDWFSFSGTQGQTVFFLVDSLNASIENAFRLICIDGSTRLALSDPGAGLDFFGGQIVFTLPSTGTYYVRPAAPPSSGSSGGYRVRSAYHRPVPERSRDHRDAFVSHSDDGFTWTTPVMVNDDPPYYDDWMPEVAVDPNGVAYVEWYDWRDSPVSTCGGVSHVYLSRSANGGTAFTSFGPITTVQTAWTNTMTNIAPNQGDYLALFANKDALYPSWADGRDGDPNVYAVTLSLPYLLTPVEFSLVNADADPTRVSLTWYRGLTRRLLRIPGRRHARGHRDHLRRSGAAGAGSSTVRARGRGAQSRAARPQRGVLARLRCRGHALRGRHHGPARARPRSGIARPRPPRGGSGRGAPRGRGVLADTGAGRQEGDHPRQRDALGGSVPGRPTTRALPSRGRGRRSARSRTRSAIRPGPRRRRATRPPSCVPECSAAWASARGPGRFATNPRCRVRIEA
jgi:hypothetical protein